MDKEKILNHELVPEHEILDEDEAEEILEQYGVTRDRLPKIKEDDPVAEAIGAEKGNIIKITRNSDTAGETTYYRTVIR